MKSESDTGGWAGRVRKIPEVGREARGGKVRLILEGGGGKKDTDTKVGRQRWGGVGGIFDKGQEVQSGELGEEGGKVRQIRKVWRGE